MKNSICAVIGLVGAMISSAFGGWDAALAALLIFMATDYVSGLVVAGVFHASPKSCNGALESKAGWKGLARKCMTLLFVLIGAQLDTLLGMNYIRDAVIIAFIANELISIIENAGLMGVPLPEVLKQAVELLKEEKTA